MTTDKLLDNNSLVDGLPDENVNFICSCGGDTFLLLRTKEIECNNKKCGTRYNIDEVFSSPKTKANDERVLN